MAAHTRTYWLSMHVPYACRHAGACCSSGWPIPIERVRVPAVKGLRADDAWLRPAPGAPADVAGVLAVSESGRCVFRDEGCEIHRAYGHRALPTACQHFPREVLIDPRGVFVTLSHYCPTAADLLFTHRGPVTIVEGPEAVAGGEPEGLDARDVLPPLLVPELRTPARAGRATAAVGTGGGPILMDLAGYAAWEEHLVDTLANSGALAEDALRRLRADLSILQTWRPGHGALVDAITALRGSADATHRAVLSPDDLVVKRYLAARAFASWVPYQSDHSGSGIAALLDVLSQTLVTLRGHWERAPLKEAIRQTDLELVHLARRT